MLESFASRALLLKQEVTEGTDVVPTPAVNAIQFLNGSSNISSESITRPRDRPFFTNDKKVITRIRGFIEGDIELAPVGVAGDVSPLGVLLKIAGMAETITAATKVAYTPVSTGVPSASAYFYQSGLLRKLLGARADISQVSMAIGDYFKARTRIEGSSAVNTEAAYPAGLVFSSFLDPAALTTETMSLSVNGFLVDGVALTLDFGNEIGTTEHTEARVSRLRNRKASGSLRFYRSALASLNVEALFRAQTVVPVIGLAGIGLGAGKQQKLTCLAAFDEPRETEIDGDFGYEIPFRCIATDAGNDEFKIEFGTLA